VERSALEEVKIAEEFYRNTSTYFSNGLEYESVFALLIHWRDNDIAPDHEIAALRKLFEDDYNFEVATFPIPTHGGQQRLALEISSIVYQWSNKLNSLISFIMPDIVLFLRKQRLGGQRRSCDIFSVYTPRLTFVFYPTDRYEKGNPTLSWSACQHSLFGALGDVLIILDCCEAAVYSKGSKEQGRFEMLAASAKGVPTPEPGTWSFTSFLMRELRRNKDRNITARELASLLWEQDQIQRIGISPYPYLSR
jgi:hypothetical protein